MKVILQRLAHLKDATIGHLMIENVAHEPIYTLENPKRETDVDSCVPAGTYQCVPYSSEKHPDVYEVTGVEGRTKILIHQGNTQLDTEGCVLLGNRIGHLIGMPAVLESRNCFDRFRQLVGKNSFTLEILD